MSGELLGRGALVQLVSFGSEDLILTGEPQITFYKNLYKRHTDFAIESIPILFTDIPSFNTTNTIVIRRQGDLISKLYLELTLPYDINLVDSYWTNRVGFNLLNRIELYIGKKLIDRLYGIWMHIWTELTHNYDMKELINKMVGNMRNDGFSNGLPCNVPHKLIIPLPFFFCKHIGLALPLNAIRNNQDITLKFFFEKKENCIQTGTMPSGDISNVVLWGDYIFLETPENRLYLQKDLEYLIDVNQHLERNLVVTGTKSIRLPFNLPCKELQWVVYNNKRTGDKFTDFTNSNYNSNFNSNSNSMVQNVQFKFNTKDVFSSGARNNIYFNYVQPYQHLQSYPDIGINTYSFCLYPNDLEPSGIINFRNLKTAVMNITTYENGYIHIFASSYNILKIKNGNVDLVYKF
jgi:hypothetical protein